MKIAERQDDRPVAEEVTEADPPAVSLIEHGTGRNAGTRILRESVVAVVTGPRAPRQDHDHRGEEHRTELHEPQVRADPSGPP